MASAPFSPSTLRRLSMACRLQYTRAQRGLASRVPRLRPASRRQRNASVRHVEVVGRATWKRMVGYHRRSLVETAFFRLKTVFGARLSARTRRHQQTEATIRCLALNRMTHLGMPDSYPVLAG